MKKICEKCGSEFEAKQDRARFCSRRCFPRSIPVLTVECVTCHQVRQTIGWRTPARCRNCVSDSHSGSGSPRWRGGHHHWSPGRYGRDKDGLSWKAQRRAAWQRDDETCQHCKTKKGRKPDVHHIIPFRISQSHALDNLLCLCQSCHLIEEAKVQDQWGGRLVLGENLEPRGPAKAREVSERTRQQKYINQFILDNFETMSQSALAKVLSVSQPAISLRFKRLGIVVAQGERRRKFLPK